MDKILHKSYPFKLNFCNGIRAMNNYQLVRNANINLTPIHNDQGHIQAHISINDEFEHTFTANSRISKALSFTDGSEALKVATAQLRDRLNGGNYFLVDDQLVDFRDSQYIGFIHSDSNIDKMVQHIGIKDNDELTRNGLRLNTTESDYLLMNRINANEFDVPGYLRGGKFQTNILFNWNPFTSFVKGAFELVREVCTNGMVGSTDLINTRIPIINRWEEHLNIAQIQIGRQVNDIVVHRLADMGQQRSSVRDLQLIAKHAADRANETNDIVEKSRLQRIGHIADPVLHLRDYYNDSVFKESNVSAQVPGHLTQFDAFNLATEINTHTKSTDTSTDGSLQIFANRLLFPSNEQQKTIINKSPIISAFSDPDLAFFGA